MTTQSISLPVSPSIGTVSAEYVLPDHCKCILTLAHGAGAGMNHVFMKSLAQSLAENGIATLRFNFPFAEKKKFRPDVPAIAHKTIEAAISHARETLPSVPLFTAGKSFGGRMSSQYLSTHPQTPVKGIIFYGFPLHPSGTPSVDRAEHLKEVKVPMLFLQGTRDELASWDLITSVCSGLPLATLEKLEGADHAFKAGKQNLIPVLCDKTIAWIEKTV